jgi:pimeloyl-ACP methyl ester carboxylesterase
VRPETRYARSGDISISYQVLGAGPLDLVLVPGFVSHLEASWDEPNLAHLLMSLASFSRLILFDKRGTGLSDPVTDMPTMAQRMDDIRAVMDDVGSQRAAILGISEGGTLGMLFAVEHPRRLQALVLYGSWARRMAGPGYPWGPTEDELESLLARMDEGWATGRWWDGDETSPFDTPPRWVPRRCNPSMMAGRVTVRVTSVVSSGTSIRGRRRARIRRRVLCVERKDMMHEPDSITD